METASLAPPSAASGAATASSGTAAPTSSALFREIHKNAWLKRLPTEDGLKILSVSQKRGTERWWMVFCVHGDTEPYLEAYDDGSAANTHVPRWRTPLSRAHHVSGSIRHTGRGEYEFVVATQDGALRLVAPTREAMQDWVDTLRNKLREMKILAPQENVYSKAPEQLKPRAPTRDPTSPLPPPPPGPTVRVPGTEPLRLMAAVNETAPLSEVAITTTQSNATANLLSNPIYVDQQAEPEADVQPAAAASNQPSPTPGTSVDLSEEFFNVRSHINKKQTEQKTDGATKTSSENAWENFEDMDTTLSEDVNISIPSTSKTAKISGMNVCLVDSILDRRLDTDSDDEFFAEFDAACSRSEDHGNHGNTNHRRFEITEETNFENLSDSKKKEIRLKYSQVNLKTKVSHNNKFEQFKKNLLDSASDKKEVKEKKSLKINNSVEGNRENNLTSNITVEESTSKSPLNNNTEVNHNAADVKVIQAKPVAAIRKKILLDRTSSVPDTTGKEMYLENFSAELVQDVPGSSNITIINVSNDHSQRNQEQSKPDKHAQSVNNYVNVETKVTTTKDHKETSIKIQKEEPSRVSVGSGYGHIRHHSSDKKDPNISITPVIFIKPPPGSKPRRKSESGVSTIHVENDVSVNNKPEGFYESVFTSDSKDNQVVVKISDTPKLVVRSSSPKVNNSILDTPVLQVPSSSSSGRSVIEITSVSQSTDLSNRDITGNYELLSMTQNSEMRNRNTQPNTRLQESALEALINTNAENLNDTSRNVTRTNFKPGLFTRGLTELSIVSKFRNLSSANNGRQQLVKNSQFYSDYEDTNQVLNLPVSSSSSKKPSIAGKLSIFNKFSEGKKDGVGPLKGSRIEAVQRVESSLRRNWSEHNDRTAPIAIVRAPREPMPQVARNVPENNSRNLNEEMQTRRRSSSLSSTRTNTEESNAETTSSPPPSSTANNSNAITYESPSLRPLTLREQQVCRLRSEMRHAGGVRLRMRSRDCPGEAMALVDAYGAVWIAGWKQKSHPLLYNALHIGDRLAAVSGTPVTTSRQAKKLLRDTSSGVQFIELIIKRLPHARVFALRKDSDTQELGLIMDLATIAGLVPNTPAARGGIPSSGTLTEINGRPLNLLLKKDDSQVRDRLNAIGKDISLLIQPTEFVQLLRTGLKSVRSHKDYIIQ